MRLNGYIGTINNRDDYFYENGKTEYSIVIPFNSSACERFSAEELKRILGFADVEIEIYTDNEVVFDHDGKYVCLGDTRLFRALNVALSRKEFKFDGFIIESVGNSYVIKGVSDTGTCFGVYGFMEYIAGYRYYAPDEIAIDKTAKNKQFHIKDVPTFFGRNVESYETVFDMDHAFRLRINGEFSKREQKHGEGSPWSSLSDQSYATQILDFRKYEKDHPDWYVWSDYGKYPQICYSKGLYDKEFYDTFLANLINNYIIPEKDKIFFMLGMSDNNAFCECEQCKKEVAKYTRSGLALRFINKVASDVENWRKKNAPERTIFLIGFAYITIFDPPVVEKDGDYYPIDESVVAKDNVMIQIAPIQANYMYCLTDPVYNVQSRAAILGWNKVAKNLCIWDYRSDFRTQSFLFPTTLSAQANNDLYARINVMDVFNQDQPFTAGGPFVYMDDFARSKMHWNAKERYAELVDEFLDAYYKDASGFVKEYLQEFERYYSVMLSRGWNVAFDNHASLRREYYTIEDMLKFKTILDKALDRARSIKDREISEKVVKRVETLTLFYKFVLLLLFTLDIPRDEAFELLRDLRRICSEVGFVNFWRRKPTEDYLSEAEKILNGEKSFSELFPVTDGDGYLRKYEKM